MRHAPLAILALTRVASADSIVLSPIVDDAPAMTGSCVDGGGLSEKKRVRLDGHTVRVVDECGSTDLNARLVFEVDGGWRTYTSAIIAYQGANMTDAPLHISLLLEHTSFITLAGKRRALVHRVDTLHREIRMDGTIESTSRESRVDVCVYNDGIPACGYAEVECPKKGCKAPDLSHGAVALYARTGRKEFSVE